MGCTSSAPNSIPPNANTADKSIQFEEETVEKPSIEVDVADTEDESRMNETKVLPSCDTIEEPVQLVRNNKSTTSLVSEKDGAANGHVTESEDMTKTPENKHHEVKIPKLELLMNKVFETNHHMVETDTKEYESGNAPAALSNEESIENVENIEENNTTTPTESNDIHEAEVDNTTIDAKSEEGEAKESSPSQSQSSRATRWEALADIAAELPPSLAVDPITGQIYALTK